MPAKSGASPVYPFRVMANMGAQALKYLEFLVEAPVRSVAPYEAGIPVMVPAPERFAVHKLIVTCLRASHDQA